MGTEGFGRIVFLGLGTGLGSTLISKHVFAPLKLSALRYRMWNEMVEPPARQPSAVWRVVR